MNIFKSNLLTVLKCNFSILVLNGCLLGVVKFIYILVNPVLEI